MLLNAKDQRLVKTKVADVLALLPATDNQQASRLFQELINLGDEGLIMVTEKVQPNGNAEGVASRYAVSLLTHYATTKEEKAKIAGSVYSIVSEELLGMVDASGTDTKGVHSKLIAVIDGKEQSCLLKHEDGHKH